MKSAPFYSLPSTMSPVPTSGSILPKKSFIFFFVIVSALLPGSLAQTFSNRDVKSLEGESDFNNIDLHWQYRKLDDDIFQGFKVTYCEDQAWGPHRCRNVEFSPEDLTQRRLRSGLVEYKGRVSHLRMSTNYTIEVTPIVANPELTPSGGSGRSPDAKGRAIPDFGHSAQMFIQTKGFSARAVSCLTNSTLVEVDTGPNFGGKISVEGSQAAACATNGDSKKSTSKYRLNIDHALCGSEMFNDSVRTYVLVQENLPILTHSTRRFMVVCHYIPEAFTVSAGVSLPGENSPDLVPVDQSVNEVDPSELFDSTNTLFNSQRFSRQGRAMKLKQEPETAASGGSQMWTQLVLMVVLVTGAVIGLSCAFWHFGRHAGVAAAIKGGLVPRTRGASTDHSHPDIVIVSDVIDPHPSLSESTNFDDMLDDLESPRLTDSVSCATPELPPRSDSFDSASEMVLNPTGFVSQKAVDVQDSTAKGVEPQSDEDDADDILESTTDEKSLESKPDCEKQWEKFDEGTAGSVSPYYDNEALGYALV